MIVPIIDVVLGLVSLTLFCISKVKSYSYRTVIIKGITSLLFLSLGIYGMIAMEFRTISFFVVPGLFLGLLGDLFLDLKYVSQEREKGREYLWTMVGFFPSTLLSFQEEWSACSPFRIYSSNGMLEEANLLFEFNT